jgi:hypothetical protein
VQRDRSINDTTLRFFQRAVETYVVIRARQDTLACLSFCLKLNFAKFPLSKKAEFGSFPMSKINLVNKTAFYQCLFLLGEVVNIDIYGTPSPKSNYSNYKNKTLEYLNYNFIPELLFFHYSLMGIS